MRQTGSGPAGPADDCPDERAQETAETDAEVPRGPKKDRHITMRNVIASLRRLRDPDQLQRDRQRRRIRGLSR